MMKKGRIRTQKGIFKMVFGLNPDAPEFIRMWRGWGFLLASFNNQTGTNSAIFSMLTGLIPLLFDDCLPFSMFTIADISKINSADFNQTLEKFNQKCFV